MMRFINGRLVDVATFAEPSEVQVDAMLTSISIGFTIEGYVADQILPRVPVPNLTVKVPTYSRDALQIEGNPIKRADKAPYARGKWSVSYAEKVCAEWGIEIPVSDLERSNAQGVIDPMRHANGVANQLMANQIEYNVCSTLTDTTVMTSNATLSGGNQWSDYTNSSPLVYVKGKMQTIQKAIHRRPNLLVLGEEVADVLAYHPSLSEFFKYTRPGVVTPEMMAQAFRVDRVVIASATYDTQNIGQSTQAGDYIWGKHVLLCYVGTGPEVEMPAVGYQLSYQNRRTQIYREERITSDIVRVNELMLAAVTNASSGYLIKNAVA
ncbi:MAG TPA: hypothetical protein VMX57_03925 [Planctomycetota bacterium]|nr:hypothetical protein [Planctomycetota bacterium]